MKVKVDSFLRAEDLNGATSKTPVEFDVLNVKFIKPEDLPFPSEDGKYEMKVGKNGEEFDWLVNKSSLRILCAAFGDESDAWVGKTIKLYSVEQKVGVNVKQVIYVAAA